MNKELKHAIKSIIIQFHETPYIERNANKAVNTIMKQIYIYKGKIDYRSKYVDMCVKDEARLTGFDLNKLNE